MIETLVLTGFLGSGKTTLLGRLLRHPVFSKTAVIINEFGEIGLDHELIEASADSLIELQTGCLCCKIRNDLAATLHDLLRRRDEGSVTAFTRIVIETSGLADPAPILQTLMTDAGLACRLALGGVVTTVDAVTGAATLIREDISVKQVALADRLVLTKTDLVGPRADRAAAPPDLIGRLRSLNATAPLLQACHGEVDPECLFDSSLDDPLANSVPANSVLARPIGQGPFPSPSSGRVDARSAAGWGFLRLLFSKSPAFKKPHPARGSALSLPEDGEG